MRLEKGIIKDIKLGREEVVGLKLNGTYLYETTGLSRWNKYTIQIPKGKYVTATVYDKDSTTRNKNNYDLYVDWGIGTPTTYDSSTWIAQKNYNTSGISTPYQTYNIRTTGELMINVSDTGFLGDFVKDIASVRTDYITGAALFENYSGIVTVREPVLERLNTSIFKSMRSMFSGCSSIEKLNLVSFNTSNVTDMGCMFQNCKSLVTLDLSNFNTNNTTNISSMFYGCESLKSLNISSFRTDKVNTMTSVFSGCKSLTSLDLRKFNTSNVENMMTMFKDCTRLETLDIRNFDTSKVTRKGDVVPGLGTAMTDGLDDMLQNCVSLRVLRLDNCSAETVNDIITTYYFPTNKISGVTRTIYCQDFGLEPPTNWVFNHNIEEEPVEPEVPENLYKPYQFKAETKLTEVETIVNESHDDLSEMFFYCENLVSVNTQDWNTNNVITMKYMFAGCNSLPSVDLSKFNTSKVVDMSYMFTMCGSLKSLDLSNFDTKKVTNMRYMFNECYELEELNLSGFDTTSITDTYYVGGMLEMCESLHTLHLEGCDNRTIDMIINSESFPDNDISGTTRIIYCDKDIVGDLPEPTNWKFSFNLEEEPDVPVDPPEPEIPLYQAGQFKGKDVKVVTTMVDNTYTNLAEMFKDCTSLTSVNVQDWDVSNVRNMSSMFSGCASLTTLDLNNWNVSKLYYVDSMFYNCTNLTSLDVSNWNASSIEYLREAFYNCNSLIELDLSSWKPTITGTDGCQMFAYCSSLEVLDIRNFYIDYYDSEEDYVVRNMFEGCNSLHTLYLNNCNAYTLDQILAAVPYRKSEDGVIYCKKASMIDAEKEINNYNSCPGGWRFEYID